ncbi:MAG: hypothetical protein DLM54_02010 [Acidimicrobiales bacterium]|nr:MAG: hypothetical protein DLM54_02010 [Acidimicrobiales bacterium]
MLIEWLSQVPNPATPFRPAVVARMGRLFGADRLPQEQYTDPPGDPGLFGPRSVTWRVHANPAMVIGGFSAVMLQTLHPLAMAGVADHSAWREEPLRRLSRTSSFVVATTYGSIPVADAMIEVVKAVHARVVGTAPDGRSYSANDPALLRWIHVAEVTSFLRAYQQYEPWPLSGADADRYLDEVAVVAERLGATEVPRSRAQVRAYLREVRPELAAGEQARGAVEFVRNPLGDDPWTQAAYGLVVQAGIGLLPGWARAMLGLHQSAVVERTIVRPATWSLISAMRLATGPPPALIQAQVRCAMVPAPVGGAGCAATLTPAAQARGAAGPAPVGAGRP